MPVPLPDRRKYVLPGGSKDLIHLLKLNAKKPGTPKFGLSPAANPPSAQKPKRKVKISPTVSLPSPVVVKDLASALGIKLYKLINLLKEMDVFTGVHQKIPFHLAAKVARRFGFIVQKQNQA